MELSNTDRDQLYKVEWEGSILDAIDSGVTHTKFDSKELQQAWKNVEELYAKMTPDIDIIDRALDEVL